MVFLAFLLAVFVTGDANVDDRSLRRTDAGEQVTVRDTVPTFRYDFGIETGYDRIKEGTQEPERYASLSLLPEVYYGKVGVGLLATIRVHPRTGNFREEDFDRFRDYLALLHFVEYGTEENPTNYARVGSMEDVSLGEGLFLDQYSNAHRIDDPMRGFTGAVADKHLYFEGVYSDLAAPGIAGFYAGYYPFGTEQRDLFSRLAFGIGLAADLSTEGDLVNSKQPGAPFLLSSPPDSISTVVPVGEEDGSLFMVGADASVRWIETEAVTIVSFAEVGKIIDYGAGATLGARGKTDVSAVELQAQYAQRFLGSQFLPDYFNSSFESQRIRSVSLSVNDRLEGGAVNTRRNELAGRTSSALGHKLHVEAELDDVFETTVGYETIWGEANTGRFHLDLEVYPSTLPVAVTLGYDRFNLQSLSNLLAVSRNNSLYRLGVAYEVIDPLRLGVEVRQNFEPVYRGGRVVDQRKQNRVEPYVRLTFRL